MSVNIMWLCIAVLCCVCVSVADPQFGAGYPPPQPPGTTNQYRRPYPGDVDYKTYVYNSRRYGQSFPDPRFKNQNPNYNNRNYPNYNPNNPGFNPNYNPNDPNFNYQEVSTNVPLPGVLGGWRPDIQGKQRADYLELQRTQDIFVSTTYGQIQGFKVHLYDNPDPYSQYRPGLTPVEKIMGNVSVFLGVPYAMPPVLDGRFRPPRAHKGWQLLQAVDFGPACPQPIKYVGASQGVRDMDEDCLYLNVYSPYTGSGVAQKYAVMMYIHGGEFYKGSSNAFPAHMLAAFYDVVVVTFNYRLGALGFLSTADQNAPGNYGILDQQMALKWVYDNIEFFNGDRNSITLFGPGAGAASAGLLMVAPRTRHMVNKVIAQSGSALADWALVQTWQRAQNTSKVFGRHLGCAVDSSWKLVSCLRIGRSFYEIGNAEFRPDVGLWAWGPVLDVNYTVPSDSWYRNLWTEDDWHLMPATPEQLIKEKKFNPSLRYMSSVTTHEAAYIIYNNETLAPYYHVDLKFFDQKVRELVLQYNYTLNQEGVYQAIHYMYTYWPDPTNITHIREQYINLMSDFLYRAPSDKMTKLLLEHSVPVYMYVLNTTVEALRLPEWRKVPHDTELLFLTGAPFMDVEFYAKSLGFQRNMWTEADRNMSHFFMKAYSDFARFGNPSHQQILGLHFEVAQRGILKYLNVNTTFNSSIMYNYRQTEMAFWTDYLPTVIGHLFPIYRPYYQYWWEPKEPIQIAFWSITGVCLLLVAALVMCCILWQTAKRSTDRYYSGDLIKRDDDEGVEGVDNMRSMYEFKDTTQLTKRPVGTPPPEFKSRPTSLSLSKSTTNVLMHPEGAIKGKEGEGVRSHSTPSLRSNGSQESIRMVPGSKKGIRRSPNVPQTQV